MSWFDKAIANAGVDKRDDYGEQAIEREQQAQQEAADYDTAWNYIKHGDIAGLSDYTDRNYNYRDIPFLGQVVGHASDAATQGIADFAQFVGAEGVGNYLNDAAQRGEEYLPPMSKPELSWNYISDPNGMASAFGSVVGSMLPIGAAAYLAPVGGLTAAAANAASKVPLMGGLLSASAPHAIRWGLTGPVEAAMEAGSGERDMREQGMSNEEARQKSWDIFGKNAALLAVTNAVEGAALPHIFKGITKAAQNGSRLAGAGRFAGAAATETGMNALEEGEQQGIQNSVMDKPYSINPLNWSDDQIEAAEFGVAGTLPFALAGLPATIRGMRRNDNPMQNDALEAARAAVEQPAAEDVPAYIDEEPATTMPTVPTASRGYTIDGDNSLDGFDSRYVSKWESAPGATDLASVRPEVKSAFNGLAAEYGDGLTLTGGAEKGYHAGGADGHEGGWKLDVDKSSVKDKDSFLALCAKYGFKVGDEGDHYDLSANPNGGVGGQVVATPDTYAGSNGGQREGNENAWAVYDVFRGAGYSNEAIAGILGRVQQEHNFDTSDVPEHEEEGMHVGGYGMFQWNGGRTTAFKEWAEANNLDPQDARVQAQYALQEAQERGLTPEKMNQLSAEEAADLWTDEWEVGKRGNERQFANEWLGRIKSGGRSEASDINLPNYDDSSNNERGTQLAADQSSWDKVAERGREEENPEKPETQEELVNQAKERAVDAGDMDKTAEIITAQRSGDTKKLAEIAEKERKAKAKAAKGKEAPKAPKIEQKTPVTDALRRRAQKANMAAQMNDDTTTMYQIARALSQNDGAEINRIADSLGIPAEVKPALASDEMVSKTRDIVEQARNAGIKFNEQNVMQTLAQRDDEQVNKLYNYAQKELAQIPSQTTQKAAESVPTPVQKKTPAISSVETVQPTPNFDGIINEDRMEDAVQALTNKELSENPTLMPKRPEFNIDMDKVKAGLNAIVDGHKAQNESMAVKKYRENAQRIVDDYRKGDKPYLQAVKELKAQGKLAKDNAPNDMAKEQILEEYRHAVVEIDGANRDKSAETKKATDESSKEAVQKDSGNGTHNTITDLQKAVKGRGRKALTKALEAGYKPVDGENAIESPEGEKYYLNEAATKAFAKDYEAKLAKEPPVVKKEPEKVETDQKTAQPEKKLHRVRRGREEIAAVAKKYENGEITAKEAYSQVSAIAKDTATVPKDGLPNVTYIDGKMKLDLTDYGNRLIDETTVSKQEKPAETANTTVTNNDTEEVATNEQPRTGESTDGGHGDVESRGSGENEPEGTGEVSGRDGREGTPVRGDDGKEHSNESEPAGVRAGTELETPASERTDKRGNQPEVSLTEAEAHPSPTETPGHNYEIKDTDVSTKSEKVRFKQNVDAIKLLKQLETDDRMPTPAEQEILGAYNGWGGLKDAFLDGNEMNKELRELLTDEEYKAARSTINDAFYTPPKIIRAIWEGVSHLGFKGGRVLDPSMGVGNFFGTMPRAMMDKSMLRGVEIDSLTSRLGKMLYPNAFVENKGFQKAEAADNFYDLVISNIPFGQNMIDGYQIHNYFFANGMDKVRPGGLMVYITSQGSLAGGKDAVRMRNYLNKQADLIAAYKLPSGVFSDAGTQVATDIVVFRKHDADGKKSPYAQKFTEVKPVESGSGFYTRKLYDINEYFDKHRENILGETSAGKDQWGNPSLNVKMAQGTTVADVAGDLENAMKKLPKDVYAPVNRKKAKAFDPAAASKRAMADEKTRDYEYYFKDGEPVQNQNGKETPLTGKKAKVVGDYIKLKNTLNALFAAESDPKAANKDVEGLRKRLNKDYDAFVAKHGQLTGAAASSFNDDPSAGMVQALEKPIEETYTDKRGNERKRVVGAEKADIFTTRSIKPVQEVTHVETADDALIASLANRGGVDVDYMAKLMDSKPEQVISKLKGKLFQNPVTEEYETRDEYLSGNVREKLAQAKEAAKENKAYENNVKELEKVIPEDLVSDEIYVNLGTPWIPVQDVQAFVDSVSDNITVKFSRGAALWNVSGWGSSAKYKLKGITFGELLDHVLNNKAIQIFDGKGEDKVFNQEKTDAANVAAEELQQDFKDWIWKDKERENRLVKYYNDNYNNMVVRRYNGQHLNLHNYGMNAKINLKPHQKDVVWRMLQGGNTLIAHCVGAGKTFEMQTAGMEMRRLGIANKPMYCLPNNVVQQFAREFRQLYPNAKLLVLQSNDLPAVEKTTKVVKTDDGRTKRVSLLDGKSEKQKADIMARRTARNRMLNRIRTEDWDGVIISHNLFQRFPVTPDTAAEFIQQQIDELENTIREAKADKSMDTRALSNLENAKRNLQERLDETISTDVDDIGVPFEELGIDQIFVDEADMFKNLEFATRLGNIRGLSNSKAKRSQDMFIKTQWLTNNMGGRGVVFATGTPVSNTMSELYTMTRYLDMRGLKEKGLELFDNWMRTFGDIGQGIERKPTGDGFRKVTMIKRFVNMAELTKMFRSFADVKTQDELNLDIPKLKNDKSTVVALAPDAKVVDYIKNVVPKRVAAMKSGFKKEKGEDNMLSLTNDLRKLSLTDSKIEACADKITKKYNDTADIKGTQLVFCDMGIPKAESDKASDEVTTNFDVESPEVYRTLIGKLKEKGISDKDIAFIQNYSTKEKRDAVFQKVNSGDVRILIGSTETMGAGTNCQQHLVALHDLDAPWRPRDLEQRHGRILRQGNQNKEVEIFNYVVKDSFDANMWEKLKNKAAIIQQAMSGDMNLRTVEDSDLVTLSYAEVEGAATGNPLIKEQLQVQNDLTKYQHAQTAFKRKVRDAENTLDGSEENIAEQEKVIAKIEKDIASRKDTRGDKFSMYINGKGYKERAKAQEALDKVLNVLTKTQSVEIGQIGGFKLTGVYRKDSGEVELQLVNNRAYGVKTNSVQGIENTLHNAPEQSLKYRQGELDSYKEDVAQAKEIVEQENPYAAKVKELSDRLNQLNREIESTLVDDGKQKVAQAEDTAVDSEPETEVKEPVKEEKPALEKEGTDTFTQNDYQSVFSSKRIDANIYEKLRQVAEQHDGKRSYRVDSKVEFTFSTKSAAKAFTDEANAILEEKSSEQKDVESKAPVSDRIIVATVPPAGKSTKNVNVDEFKHTKTGKMIPAASLKDHVDKDFRKQATAIAKNHGGKWSPFAKRILFKTEEGRDDFVREVEALLSVTADNGKASAKGEMRRAIERATVVDNDDLTPQQRKMSEFGKEMGTPILWIDTNPNMHGYHVPDGTTVLNVRSKMPLSQVFWHEAFHWIANNNANLYRELTSYFKGKDAFTSKQLEAYRNRIGRPEMSDELTIEEMLADNFEEVKNRVKIFKEMGAEQPSLARKFVAWVKRIMDKFAEFFHNPEGKLTTSQRDSFVKAFGRLARDMKDGNGRPLFKVYKEGKEIKLPSGQLVTDGIKLSGKNDVDKAEKVGDNVSKEVFDKYLTKGIMSMIRDTVTKEIGDNVDLSQMRDPIKRDETRDTLPYIKDLEVKYNQLVGMKAKQEYLDRLATKIEYARRCFDNDKRIRNESVRPLVGNEGQSRVYQADDAAVSRSGRKEGQRDGGRAGVSRSVSGGRRSSREHFEKLYNDMAKHSEKGAFSSKETKMSYSASDNSNESLFHKIKNMLGGRNNIDAEKFRYRKHLTEMLENALDVKIRYGKMDGKANVVYKANDKVLRSRHAYDWENILPFAGKLAAEKLGIKNPSEEMRNYIADWILTGAPNNVSKEAAQFHKAMQNNIPMATRLQDLQDAFAEWMGKDYREQMQGTIQWKNVKKTSWKERKEKLYEEWVEELEPINRLTKQVNAKLTAQGKSKLNEVTDPMIAFRLLRGQYGRTETMLEGENENAVNVLREVFPNVDFTNFKTLHMILKDIDAFQNTERQKDFVTYCTACHVMDMHQHNDDIRQEQQHLKNKMEKLGEDDKKEKNKLEKEIDALNNEIMPIPAAYTKENCQEYIDDGYKDFHDAQQDLVRFSNTTAAILADSGVISDKRYSELLNKWQNYVPLFRVFDDNEDIDFGDSMKHIKGSTRDIVNPLESIIRNTAKFMQRAESNKARQLLADVARCDASGWLIEEVDKSADDKTTITFYENGKRKYLQTDPDIVRAVNNMGIDSSHMFIKFLHAITKLARACFTMASPEFALRNVARDWGDASLYTKHGWWLNPLDIARGFMHAWNKTDVYYEWLSSGAAQASALSLDRNYTQSTLDKMGRGYWKRLGSKDFFNALLEGLQKAGEYSEYGTRIAMYQKTKNAMLKENPHASKAEIRQAITAAAFESRDLMDFARHGKAGAEYNKITAFANASIQGWDKLYRSLDFKNDPKRATRVAAKLALYGILPAMALFLLHHDDDWYKEAPNWLKETHWLFKFGDTIIRVPKANDMGIRFLSNAVEKGMDEMFNKHPHKAKEYFMPMWDALPNLTPTSILPIMEIQANHSYFTDRPIIPQAQEKLPAKLQYGPYTTSFAKWIGEKFNVAPRNVEHFISGYLGTLGMALPKAIDMVTGEKQQSLSLEEMPLVRGYLYPQYKSPQSVNDFYEQLDEQTKLKNEYKLTHQKPEGFDPAKLQRLENAQKQLRKVNKQEKSIIDNPKWSLNDREVMQRNIQKKRIEIAKRALGQK